MAQQQQDLLDRIAKLERQVQQLHTLATSRKAFNAINAGTVTISGDGGLILRDAQGRLVYSVTTVDNGEGPQESMALWRAEDGSAILYSYNYGTRTTLQWYDDSANVVVGDDDGGFGLRRPWIGAGGFYDFTGAVVPQSTTTSSSYETVQMAPWYRQHPQVTVFFLARSSASGTTGNVRLVDDSGRVIGSPVAVPSGFYGVLSITGTPDASIGFTEFMNLNLQAERTAGTGTIGVQGCGVFGTAS
jgi:hypothetical protein